MNYNFHAKDYQRRLLKTKKSTNNKVSFDSLCNREPKCLTCKLILDCYLPNYELIKSFKVLTILKFDDLFRFQ